MSAIATGILNSGKRGLGQLGQLIEATGMSPDKQKSRLIEIQKELQEEAQALRVKTVAESKESPFHPQISQGAVVLLEQHVCSRMQEGIRNAGIMCEASSRVKVSFDQAMLGLAMAADRASGANKTLVALDPPKKRVSRFDKLKREAAAKKAAETRAKSKEAAPAAAPADDGEEM